MTEESGVYYTFQCPVCYIVSGFMSTNPAAAPTCCRGKKMVAIRHDNGDGGDTAKTCAECRHYYRKHEQHPAVGKYIVHLCTYFGDYHPIRQDGEESPAPESPKWCPLKEVE